MTETTMVPEAGTLEYVGLAELHENADNIRTTYPLAGIKELAASILTEGVLQPLLVMARDEGGYTVIAGNRRRRALVWLRDQGHVVADVPVSITKSTDAAQVISAALIENLQREDLNPIDEAKALSALVGFGMKQKEIGERIGRSQTYVSKRLAFLTLEDHVQKAVVHGWLGYELAYQLSGLPVEVQKELTYLEHTDEEGVAQPMTTQEHWDDYDNIEYDIANRQRAEEHRKAVARATKGLKAKGYLVVAEEDVRGGAWQLLSYFTFELLDSAELPEGAVVVVVSDTRVKVFVPYRPVEAAPEVEVPEGATDVEAQAIKDRARLEAHEKRAAEEQAKAREQAAEAKAKVQLAVDNGQKLVANFRKADILDLAFTEVTAGLEWKIGGLVPKVRKLMVEILGVEPERTEPNDKGATRPYYAKTISTYLASDPEAWKPRAEVWLAMRAAEAISNSSASHVQEYAASRDLPLR